MRNDNILLRLTEDEKKILKSMADKEELPLAVWIRSRLLKLAKEGK